jgi:hypothetical protein
MYVTIPGNENAPEVNIDLQLEAMGFGPMEHVPDQPLDTADEMASAPQAAPAKPAQSAPSWPDVTALVEFVSGIPWLLGKPRSQ